MEKADGHRPRGYEQDLDPHGHGRRLPYRQYKKYRKKT